MLALVAPVATGSGYVDHGSTFVGTGVGPVVCQDMLMMPEFERATLQPDVGGACLVVPYFWGGIDAIVNVQKYTDAGWRPLTATYEIRASEAADAALLDAGNLCGATRVAIPEDAGILRVFASNAPAAACEPGAPPGNPAIPRAILGIVEFSPDV